MKLKVLLTALLCLSVFGLAGHAQVTTHEASRIDKLFEDWNKPDSPGAAIGVVKDGKLIYSKGYGFGDLEHDVELSPSSVFYMASVSKQFVTMAILLLEEEGRLNLDDEIQKYLPDFPKYGDPLTIRHFIHHTSGVRDSLTLWSLSGRDIYDHVDKDAMYELLKRQKELNFKPGDKYLYSNACYFMLALIVEKLSGQSIKDYAEEKMFKPLGMKNTHFHDDEHHIVKNRVFSYSPKKDGYDNLIMRFDLVGSGGLYSNIEDMFLWDQNFYDNKLGKGEPGLIEKMHEDGLLNNGKSSGYAFGVANGKYKGLNIVSHGGALAGYRTFLLRFPDEKFSVIVLANAANFDSGGKAGDIADIFLEDKFKIEPVIKPIPHSTGSQSKPAFGNIPTKEQLAGYAGFFWNSEDRIPIEVAYLNGKLTIERQGVPKIGLEPLGGDEFNGVGLPFDIKVRFDINSAGERRLSIWVNGKEEPEALGYKPANYSDTELNVFSGRYFSEEVNAYYLIRIEEAGPVLYLSDMNMGALKPVMDGVFSNDTVGTIRFEKDRRGFRLDAGRVRNLKFVKQ